MSQTIVALATPPGRSGIGVIRLSGAESLKILGKLVGDENFTPVPRYATLRNIVDPFSQDIIDLALITYFKAPHSFTGEDVVELSCHGSPVLLRQIIDNCLRLDARLADAGEFSLRGLANGRMNLSQAEAIRDLIDAQTLNSARQSVRQLRGELSNYLQPLKDELLNLIVVLESSIEFVEDDLPDYQMESIRVKLLDISSRIENFASTFHAGKLLREGIKVVLAGRPNVGKSSIFNYLVGRDRAIVTEIAGTTRDSISETIVVNGVPVALSDTAGLRDTSEFVEKIGVDRAKGLIADSDLAIVVLDSSQDLTKEDYEVLDVTREINSLVVINKLDIGIQNSDIQKEVNARRTIKISAKTGDGIDSLREAIIETFLPQEIDDKGFLISDARHFDLLNRTKSEIDNSITLIEQQINEEIVLVGLHNAMRFLGEITGETTSEDMLTRIFSTFCIGK